MTVFFDWGPAGAAYAAERCRTIVVVDVLSFSTSVSIACTRGSIVIPSAGGDEARRLAEAAGAVLANAQRSATPEHPWSLSPAALAAAPVAERLVLPSPNGSAICRLVLGRPGAPYLVVACLRNRLATLQLLEHLPRPVGLVAAGERWPGAGLVAAGERWPGAELRPALEDLLGAAPLADRLGASGDRLSPGARLAARSVDGIGDDEARHLLEGGDSARELVGRGFEEDVALAGTFDVDRAVIAAEAGLVAAH